MPNGVQRVRDLLHKHLIFQNGVSSLRGLDGLVEDLQSVVRDLDRLDAVRIILTDNPPTEVLRDYLLEALDRVEDTPAEHLLLHVRRL